VTAEIAVFFAAIAVMIVLFLSERFAFEITALMGLLLFTFLSFLTPQEAVSGFSSPAVITLIGTFFLGAALRLTGVAESSAERIHSLAGSREQNNIIAVMLMGACVSAFMSNVAATALLLPAVASLARRSDVHPSRLFLPLSFGVVLGGMLTLIGTPPNIIANDLLRERGFREFSFFEFTPFGLAALTLSIIFIASKGRLMIPRRASIQPSKEAGNLTELYKIYERIFSLKVPPGSLLHGTSIQKSRFREALGLQIVAILRGGEKKLVPEANDVIIGGDTLVVRGSQENPQSIFRYQGLKVIGSKSDATGFFSRTRRSFAAEERALKVVDPNLLNRPLRELRFRELFGVAVVGLERKGELLYRNIGSATIQPDDLVHVVGPEDAIERLHRNEKFFFSSNVEGGQPNPFAEYLFFIGIPKGAGLEDVSIRDSRFGEHSGLTIAAVIKEHSILFAPGRDYIFKADDILLVVGKPAEVEALAALAQLEVCCDEARLDLETGDIGVVEVILSPRSKLMDTTLRDIRFRERYGFQVLAIWREGEPIRQNVSSVPLRFGDGLLLLGPRSRFQLLGQDNDFVVLSDLARPVRRSNRAWVSIAALMTMIALIVLAVQPVHIAALVAAVLVVLGGAVKMDEVYREVEWRIVFLVAALIPIGLAFENTGAAAYVSAQLGAAGGELPAIMTFLFLALTASLISQSLDSTVAVILLGPVGLAMASQLDLDVHAVLLVIALSSSIAFLTPFSHKSHLLVMGAGNYKMIDYLKIGAIVSLICLATILGTLVFFYNT